MMVLRRRVMVGKMGRVTPALAAVTCTGALPTAALLIAIGFPTMLCMVFNDKLGWFTITSFSGMVTLGGGHVYH
jgi:hypothetical protein